MQLWEQLKQSKKPVAKVKGQPKSFIEMFNAYNSTLNNSIVELKERPKHIQGRENEIDLVYAILKDLKRPLHYYLVTQV